MILTDISRGIDIGVKRETAMFASEKGLRLAIGSGDVSASTAFLGSVPGINIRDAYSSCVRFVGEKLLKLEETPFMQILPLFLAKPRVLPDAGQFFKSNHISTVDRFNDSLCNHVVGVGYKTVLLPGNFTKVSFCRFTSTGLQCAPYSLVTLGNFFDLSAAKEFIFRSDGKFFYAPVDTDDLACKFRIGNILAENHVQEDFVFSHKQLGGTSFPCKILPEMFGNGKGNLDSSSSGKQRKLAPVKPDVVTSSIIANRRLLRLWARGFLLFLDSCLNCLNGFGCFHAGGYGKLRGKIFPSGGIGFVVQRDSVRITVIPTCLTHKIKRRCVRLDSWINSFYRNVKFKFYGSCKFHDVHIVSMLTVKVNKNLRKEGQFLRHLKEAVSLPTIS